MRPSHLRIMHRASEYAPPVSPPKAIRIKRNYLPSVQLDQGFDFDSIFQHKHGFQGKLKTRPANKIVDRLQW